MTIAARVNSQQTDQLRTNKGAHIIDVLSTTLEKMEESVVRANV